MGWPGCAPALRDVECRRESAGEAPDDHGRPASVNDLRRILLPTNRAGASSSLKHCNGTLAAVLPARQMVLDIVGDLIADRRQLKQFVLDDRIVGLLGKLPIQGRLVPEIVRPIHAAQCQ
jgi:hypothetical protein